MIRDDFAIFILSHGRANNVITVETLKRCNYTGKWYIIIDNEDKQLEQYIKNFSEEHIIIFDKLEASKTFDIMDNFDGRGVPTFARNMCWKIAKYLNLTYFLEFEDDYKTFRQRFEEDNIFKTKYVINFDLLIEPYLEFLDTTNALTVAFAQTGDFINGPNSRVYLKKLTRKAMNTFFCRTDRPFQFLGRFNDDVNAYIEYGKRGSLFFTTCDISLEQCATQSQKGGITEAYLTFGTYVKSFYSVMLCPSSVKIADMGLTNRRIHHLVNWETTVPKIISSKFKK